MSQFLSWRNSNNDLFNPFQTSQLQDGATNPINYQGNAVRHDGYFGNFACINTETWNTVIHEQYVSHQTLSNQSPLGDLNPNLGDNLDTKETHYNRPLCNSKFGLKHNNGKSESVIKVWKYISVPKQGESSSNSLKKDQKQVIRDSSKAKKHLDRNNSLQSLQTPLGFASNEVRNDSQLDFNGVSASRLVQGTDCPLQLENRGRPKKRKAATSALVSGSHQMPSGIRTEGWTKASNMLINKVEDPTQKMDNRPSLAQRKRLILTTRLTQQLIPSVPDEYLKSDAKLPYQNIICHVARSALAEAFALFSPKDSSLNLKTEDRIFLKSKTQELEEERFLSRHVEDIIKKSEILESDFVSLDERSSVLYVRSDCQELEKITILNRLIKLHRTNQTSETTLRVQRHVTAVRSQMNTNIPFSVPCLSL